MVMGMARKITQSQYEELQDAFEEGFYEFNQILAEHTGIIAHSYTGYTYFDVNDNYVGNSEDFDLDDLLESAYIEVVEDGKE